MFNIGDKVTPVKNANLSGPMCPTASGNPNIIGEVIATDDQTFTMMIVYTKTKAAQGYIDGQIPVPNMDYDEFRLATQEDINFVCGIKPKKIKPNAIYNFTYRFCVKLYDGELYHNFNETRSDVICDNSNRAEVQRIVDLYDPSVSTDLWDYEVDENIFPIFGKKAIRDAHKDFFKFMLEFEVVPQFRMINSMNFASAEALKDARDFIVNSYKLAGNSHADEISEKTSSKEFEAIVNRMFVYAPDERINKRLAIYFGPAGSGKTTLATKESEGRTIVCHAGMKAEDIVENFDFVEGQPGFTDTLLTRCMREGLAITFDEISLLPYDTLQFIQGITDGKSAFNWKGKDIEIADGFKIIGTMNLVVNDMIRFLPDPLVDRCEKIVEFVQKPEEIADSNIPTRKPRFGKK